MGVDFTAYSHLTALGEHTKDPELNEGEPGDASDWCYYEDHVTAFAYKGFEASLAGFPILAERTLGQETFLFCGCYAITEKTETTSFGWGYGSHTLFREQLRSVIDPEYTPDKNSPASFARGLKPEDPFYEVLHFADNCGTISSLAAAELLADFNYYGVAFHARYGPDWGDPLAERTRYRRFQRACALAANDGLIDYH